MRGCLAQNVIISSGEGCKGSIGITSSDVKALSLEEDVNERIIVGPATLRLFELWRSRSTRYRTRAAGQEGHRPLNSVRLLR